MSEYPSPPWPEPDDPFLRLMVDAALQQAGDHPLHALVHVAAHSWQEGHILAEDFRDVRVAHHQATYEKPNPPMPSPDDEVMQTIIESEFNSYQESASPSLISSLIACAARCWAQGYQEGMGCVGCLPLGGTPALEQRDRVRSGEEHIEYPNLSCEDDVLFEVCVSTYKDQLRSREDQM